MKKPVRSAGPPAGARHIPLGYPIVVAAATFVAFIPALSGGFVNFDDDRVVVHNPYLRMPWQEAWSWIWSTTFIGHYQPLTWWSLFLDARLGGFQPGAFHLTSLLLHAAAAGIVVIVLARLLFVASPTRDASARTIGIASAAAALFWSIHPLRVESVAWISERRDPLSVLFWLLALHAYVRSVDPAAPRPAARCWYVWSVTALALSLLAKAWGMSFVVALLVIDWAVIRPTGRVAWRDKIPYAILGAISAVVAWMAQHGAVDTMVSIDRWGWTARTLQAGYGLWFYLWKTVLPTKLAVVYELPRDWHDSRAIFLAATISMVAGVALIAVRARQHRGLAAAAAIYAVTLAPVLGFAQSGPQLVADRYAYVSSLALAGLLGAVLVVAGRRAGIRALAVACAAVVVAYGAMTWRQSAVWHDSISLWRHALATGHESYLAHFDLGQALRADGRLDEAIEQYKLALDRRPDAGSGWYVYGNAMKAKGRLPESEAAYKRAIGSADPASAEWMLAHVNLGNLYFNERRLDESIEEYRAAVRQISALPPSEMPPEPYLYLGMALADRGDHAGAREALAVAARYPATRERAERELRRLSATATQGR